GGEGVGTAAATAARGTRPHMGGGWGRASGPAAAPGPRGDRWVVSGARVRSWGALALPAPPPASRSATRLAFSASASRIRGRCRSQATARPSRSFPWPLRCTAGPAAREAAALDALADQARHPGAAGHDPVVVRRRLAQRVHPHGPKLVGHGQPADALADGEPDAAVQPQGGRDDVLLRPGPAAGLGRRSPGPAGARQRGALAP